MYGFLFNRSQHPGYFPVISDLATGSTTGELVQQYKVQKTQFEITNYCDDVLKQKILAVFHNDYLEGVTNANPWFSQTTTLELLNHLYYSYGTINLSEMENATNVIIIPYYPSKPITKLLIQNLEWSTNFCCSKFLLRKYTDHC